MNAPNTVVSLHNKPQRAARRLCAAVAAVGSSMLGAAIANANPPTPTLYDCYISNFAYPGILMVVNITWDGSVYTTESMTFDVSDNGTNGNISSGIGGADASVGFAAYVGTGLSVTFNDTAEVGAYASDGTASGESWIGIDHYGS